MHKKLASDLTSLAHSILQMKNKEDVLALKAIAHQIYEKLALLAYVDEYLSSTPNATVSKGELISKIENIVEIPTDKPINVQRDPVQSTIEQPFAELEQALFGDENPFEKNDVRDVGERKTFTLDDELHDTISLDFAAEMFEKVPVKKSLNDNFQGDIQIGLNDRIAFVKHLFDGSQEDFNRVVSQLNTMKTEQEGLRFINKMIKPDYNWSGKEEYEERFLLLITRKFA
jgi:hypothetical protein